MFGDIGWAEMVLIGIVALLVIGPEDLPEMFRQLGRFTAKLRSMAREFSRAMEQAANDSGVKDVAKDVSALTSAKGLGLNTVKGAADRFEKWDPLKNAATPSKPVTSGTIKGPTPPAGSIAAPPAPAAPVVPPVAPVEAAAPVGPATQALYDKKAAKAAILRDTTEKLKALDAAASAPAVQPEIPAEAVAKKPRAPRKKKADPA